MGYIIISSNNIIFSLIVLVIYISLLNIVWANSSIADLSKPSIKLLASCHNLIFSLWVKYCLYASLLSNSLSTLQVKIWVSLFEIPSLCILKREVSRAVSSSISYLHISQEILNTFYIATLIYCSRCYCQYLIFHIFLLQEFYLVLVS